MPNLTSPGKKNLQDLEVFPIPAGDYFGKDINDVFLLYSPLADDVSVALPGTIDALNDWMNANDDLTGIREAIANLSGYIASNQKLKKVSSPADYAKLSVLLNYKCNFSCAYCYSAKGRSGKEISKASLKALIDFFIDSNRLQERKLTIFISGGGEPLLSWDKLEFLLEYSGDLAREQGFEMNYILMTNGSLLNDSVIKRLIGHKVNVCVSFEILEEIQNKQRGHYDRVVAGIYRMIELGLVPSVSSVITSENVGLMEQMVETVNKLFPQISNLNFDPVADPGSFASSEELKKFYDSFIDNYFKAHKLSRSRNCGLNCTMRGKFENLGERFCQGKLCLTPEGTLSICHSVSSPKEEAFERCNYGIVRPGKAPEFDMDKFTGLINKNMHSYPECKSCFARWHCGGGCLIYRNNYSPEMFEGVCYFTREFVKRMLLNRLESEYLSKYNNTLKTAIGDLVQAEHTKGSFSTERSINGLTKLSLLPNYTCNFSCSYCYAATGRSSKVLEKDHARAVLDFFIDPARLKGRNLYLAVLGGGEPLLSWDVVAYVIGYARERANATGFKLEIGLTTNGSVISDEIIQFLKKHDVIVSISFEILEDVQDLQRQQYREVCTVIDNLVANEVDVSLKSMITKQNVCRLEEMVAEMIRRFPSVRKLKLQPVDDNDMFPAAADLARFYDNFTRNFFMARDLGEKYGVDVYCLAFKNADYIMDHYCGGEICLTPEGTISICHRVSSPQEVHYQDFIYGDIDKTRQISFDESKFDKLISYNIDKKEKCQECFARWHCGGGCLARAYTYDEDKLNVICDWTRDFLRQTLLRRFSALHTING